MKELNYYITMAQYNQWMNQKIYAICADIPDNKRKENLGAFFKSIHGTLNHLLYGDKAWMGRFLEQPFYVPNMGQDMYTDFEQLRKARELTDKQIIEWTKNLSQEWLENPFKYKSNVDGKIRILPTWLLITHMFNHQTHHRGQLTTLLSQLGYNPGITDLPWLPSAESLKSKV
jgi:uncharacterized damage-inducible protein DinB